MVTELPSASYVANVGKWLIRVVHICGLTDTPSGFIRGFIRGFYSTLYRPLYPISLVYDPHCLSIHIIGITH